MSTPTDKERWKRHSREKYRERRAYMLATLGGKCVHCGATKNLHIDHIDPASKSFDLGTYWYRPLSEIKAELKKCQLLCRKNHEQKTALDMGYSARSHGTASMYRHHKCRCDICKAFWSQYQKDYKRRHKAKQLEP